jgi:hypothetical protein
MLSQLAKFDTPERMQLEMVRSFAIRVFTLPQERTARQAWRPRRSNNSTAPGTRKLRVMLPTVFLLPFSSVCDLSWVVITRVSAWDRRVYPFTDGWLSLSVQLSRQGGPGAGVRDPTLRRCGGRVTLLGAGVAAICWRWDYTVVTDGRPDGY